MQLTKSEMEIMEQLWSSPRALSRADFLNGPHTFKNSSIHIILNGLLRKESIKTTGLVKSCKTYARTFKPAMSQERYWAQLIYNAGKGPRLCGDPDLYELITDLLSYSSYSNKDIKELLSNLSEFYD